MIGWFALILLVPLFLGFAGGADDNDERLAYRVCAFFAFAFLMVGLMLQFLQTLF